MRAKCGPQPTARWTSQTSSPVSGSGRVAMEQAVLTELKKELVMQSWVGQGAWRRLHRRVRANMIPGLRRDSPNRLANLEAILEWWTAIWSDCSSMLAAGATVSRTLWPFEHRKPRPGSETERARLATELVTILDLPPLPELHDRGVRNTLEHSEEKGPDWLRRTVARYPGQAISGWAMGTPGPEFPKKAAPERCFRFLDTSNWDLHVGTEVCNLKALAVALRVLGSAIKVRHEFEVGLPK